MMQNWTHIGGMNHINLHHVACFNWERGALKITFSSGKQVGYPDPDQKTYKALLSATMQNYPEPSPEENDPYSNSACGHICPVAL